MKKASSYMAKRPLLAITICLVLSRVLAVGVASVVEQKFGYFKSANSVTTRILPDQNTRDMGFFDRWAHFDSGYYVQIISSGYRQDVASETASELAFFPLYPYIVKGVDKILPGHAVEAGFVASFLTSVGGIYALFLLLKSYFKFKKALVYALASSLLPWMFYTNGVLSDGLLLTLTISGILFAKKRHFKLAAGAALLLPLTKLLGVFFAIPLAAELFKIHGWPKSIKQLILNYYPLAGTGMGGLLVLAHNYRLSGDPLKFMKIVEGAWGRANSLSGVFTKPFSSVSLAALTIFALGVVAVLVINRRKLGLWWVIWGLLLTLVPLLSSPLGQLRYAVANVPLLLGLIYIFDKLPRKLKLPTLGIVLIGFLILSTAWMLDLGIMQ
jgi:hypothetical protein